VLESEQSLCGKLDLELFELAPESADARLFQVLDDELIVAARLVHADTAASEHQLAGARRESGGDISLPEHGAADLRIAILEREVPVAGSRLREIRQLPFNPDDAEAALEEQAHLSVQLRDRVDLARRPIGAWGSDAHAREHRVVGPFGQAEICAAP
jgi:hypothetical protein